MLPDQSLIHAICSLQLQRCIKFSPFIYVLDGIIMFKQHTRQGDTYTSDFESDVSQQDSLHYSLSHAFKVGDTKLFPPLKKNKNENEKRNQRKQRRGYLYY